MTLIEQIKQLRQKTNISIMECKKALEKTDGDEKKALKILEKSGQKKVMKKLGRETEQGLIEAYIHNNSKIGAILELSCETDFVAKNSQFKELAHDLTMHIAALNPKDLKELLKQPFIKDEQKTVEDLINQTIAKLGENIKIRKFVRLEI